MKNRKSHKVAALDKVLQICNAHGASYNPSNAALEPTALATLLQQAQEKVKAVSVAEAAYIMAVGARTEGLQEIPALAVRVTRLVQAMNVSKEDLDHVKMIKRRLFPGSAKPKPVTGDGSSTVPSAKVRSTSKLAAVSQTETFELLVNVVQNIANYQSHDPEMKIDGLKAKLAEIQALNVAVMQAKTNLGHLRDERDKLLEGPGGVVDITGKAKNFIRSKFGVFSLQSNRTRPTNM